MFCSNCGKELAEGTKFCSLCGASLTVVSEEAQQEALRLEEERQRKIKETEEKRLKEIEKAKEKIKAIEDYTAIVENNERKFGKKGFGLIGLFVSLISLIFIFPALLGDEFLPSDSFLITIESAIIGITLFFAGLVITRAMELLADTQSAKYAKTVNFTVKDFYEYHKNNKNVLRDIKTRTGIVALSIQEEKYKKMFITYFVVMFFTNIIMMALLGSLLFFRLDMITFQQFIIIALPTFLVEFVTLFIVKDVAKQKVKELERGN